MVSYLGKFPVFISKTTSARCAPTEMGKNPGRVFHIYCNFCLHVNTCSHPLRKGLGHASKGLKDPRRGLRGSRGGHEVSPGELLELLTGLAGVWARSMGSLGGRMQKVATAFRLGKGKACLFPAVIDRHPRHGLPLFYRSGQSSVPGQTDRRGETSRHSPCAPMLRSARASL